jgi:glycosyltransferase involved in cell wall biosynthesis
MDTWVRTHDLDGVVKLVGARSDVPELLSVMDVFVFPSLMEGLGIAVLEAMAAEVPVVASSIRPLSEIICDGETGLLVEPMNAAALAAAVNHLLSDQAFADRLRQRAFGEVAAHFDERQMVAAHERLYLDLCAGLPVSGTSL